jgi:hypothetical protein
MSGSWAGWSWSATGREVAVSSPSCYTVRVDRGSAAWAPATRRVSAVTVAAVLGSAWGLLGYALLWGLTPIFVHRTFVVSALGTVLLLPVRTVLAGIRVVEERLVGRPFQFAESNEWIGLVSAAVGAGLAALAFVGVRGTVRLIRARREVSP